jgi:hypothetical protein
MINNSLFKLDEVPTFHPVTQKYDRIHFWKGEKRKCMEGYWVSGKWIPGELYYYINFHHIIVEEGIYRGLSLPWLRDIDFEKFYIYTEAIGFSGFNDDEKKSCHRAIPLINEEYTKEDVIRDYCLDKDGNIIKDIYDNIFLSNGKPKEYVEARDYLRIIHKKQLGRPLYNNEAKHVLELSSRGYGKSYSGSGLIAANYLFDGSHDYDYYLRQLELGKPMKADTVVGAIDAKFSGDLLSKVKVAFDNLPDSHIINNGKNEILDPSPLLKAYTGSMMPGREIVASSSDSKIHHRTFQDNPFAANGTRPSKVFIDEVGFMTNLLETWEALEATQAAAQFKRLTMYGMGTGGLTTGGAAMYAHEIFYAPEEYGCLMFPDEWEDRGNIGYFVPATHALNKYKEGPNKVTNEERALKAINQERDDAKKSPTRTKLMGTIINKPLVPSEIFLRMEGTFFPVHDLKVRLAELEVRDSILNATYKYDFNLISGKSVPSVSSKPIIREFPLRKGFDMDAAVEIFEKPKFNQDGYVIDGRYISGWDVVENDGNEDVQQSLQSMFIMDCWTERIVAEYTARTYLAEEYYETARRLLMYYNARCNYEANIKGPYAYFKNKNSLHLLVETPEILKDQNLLKGSTIGNKALGTNTNDRIINWGLSLILSWLENQAYSRDEGVRNVETILSIGLLKELTAYSKDINTDRVSALIMLMILKEESLRATEISKTKSIKTKASDKFWDKAYKKSASKLRY